MINNFREQIIHDILLESGEIMLDEARIAHRGNLSTNFFKWSKTARDKNGKRKEMNNYGLPYFSQPVYYDDDEYTGGLKSTRYELPLKRKGSSRVSYMAVLYNGNVYLGAKIPGNFRDGNREQDSIIEYLKEYGGMGDSEVEHFERCLQDLPSSLIDMFDSRVISLDEYEETLMKYLLSEKYPKIVEEELRKINEEEEEIISEAVIRPGDPDYAKKVQEMLARRRATKTKGPQLPREEIKRLEAEEKEIQKREEAVIDDPLEIILAGIEEKERKKLFTVGTKGSKLEKENRIKELVGAHRVALNKLVELVEKFSFESTKPSYISNGLLSIIQARYGKRTIFWPDSFWNVK